MTGPVHKFNAAFNQLLQDALAHRGADFNEPRRLADDVLALSDFYLENPGARTPWDKPYAANAYLSYFLPLNFVRLRAVFQEVLRFLPDSSFAEIWDFGSGIGTTQWVLENTPEVNVHPFFALERAPEAIAIYRELVNLTTTRWQVRQVEKAEPLPHALGVFSYSFLEIQPRLPDLDRFAHLLIVEPSTRDHGRDLMEWRSRFMEHGFLPLAPCTHSQACPLLTQSHRDWCHQRVHFSGPLWWQRIENLLPMRNRTLTYSYLLMSRTVQDSHWRGAARVLGDTLKENGKTRQLICRGPEREFLSWLHKQGAAPEIPHGSLVRGVELAERRGGELRPARDSLTWTGQ